MHFGNGFRRRWRLWSFIVVSAATVGRSVFVDSPGSVLYELINKSKLWDSTVESADQEYAKKEPHSLVHEMIMLTPAHLDSSSVMNTLYDILRLVGFTAMARCRVLRLHPILIVDESELWHLRTLLVEYRETYTLVYYPCQQIYSFMTALYDYIYQLIN